MKTFHIGIIGYGGFGKFLHHWWNKLDNIKVIAVSDLHDISENIEACKFYQSWIDLLNDNEVDIVSIVTPPSYHAEIACAAMQSGKHVLIEKPIATTEEDAKQILKVQKETGMVATVDHMLRFNPIIKTLSRISKQEVFGKLRRVAVENYAQDSSLPPDHWFWDKKISGGIFIEHGVHFIDLVHTLTTQKCKKVYGCWQNRNEKQQDQVSAMIVYNEGLIASHYHSFSRPGFFEQTTIRLVYDLAQVEIEGWIPLKGNLQALVNQSSKDQINFMPGWHVQDVKSIDCLEDKSRPEGWGTDTHLIHNKIHSSGVEYEADELISGRFEIPQSKSQVYGSCLQDILLDLIAKIENDSHQMEVTISEAIESLKIAILASADIKKMSE